MSNEYEELRLSVSKCKTYENCHKKYQFAYILKYPQKDEDYHVLGKFCHKILEDFHNEYINGSQEPYHEVMSKAFKNACVEYKERMMPEMKKECFVLIDKYLKIITDDKKNNLSANVISCEKSFNLNITDDVILRGVIDRIQIDSDDIIHIGDYKTTKNKKYLKEDWLQLLTYAYVILLEQPDLKKIRASYILLRHDYEYITKEFYPEEILKVKDTYIEYANQIRNEKDFKADPKWFCNYCPFLEHCKEGLAKVKPSLISGEVPW